MKNIMESPETFTAYATIDAGYWMLKNLNNKLKNRKPIDRMIDESTGFDKEQTKIAISIIEEMIEAKKIIEADYSFDEEMLNQLKSNL